MVVDLPGVTPDQTEVRVNDIEMIIEGDRPLLSQANSAQRCEELVAELLQIVSADDLVEWAHRILPVKNTFHEEDARSLEEAFSRALAETANAQ